MLMDSEKLRLAFAIGNSNDGEKRKQSQHYYCYSLEHFFLSQRLDDLQSIFVLLLLNHSADSESDSLNSNHHDDVRK